MPRPTPKTVRTTTPSAGHRAPGRHRAPTRAEVLAEHKSIASDVRAAIARTLSEIGETYRPAEWDITSATLSGWVARRRNPTSAGHDNIIVSLDCRSTLVPAGTAAEDLDTLANRFCADAPLPRGLIEYLLVDVARFHRGPWHIEPIGDLGYACARTTRFGTRKHYLVASNHRVAALPQGPTSAEAHALLTDLLHGPPTATH